MPEAPLRIPPAPGRPEPIAPICAPAAPPIIPNANACCAQSAIAPAAPKKAAVKILFLNIFVFISLFVLCVVISMFEHLIHSDRA
jgi:hypothetical protein